MNISKGLKNLFTPTIFNVIIAICLIIILILVYLKTKKIDLFNPTTGILLQQESGNIDFVTTFINKYVNNIQQKSNYAKVLATQEQTIQNLSKDVSDLINTSI
jgi:hypothetical protein